MMWHRKDEAAHDRNVENDWQDKENMGKKYGNEPTI